MADGLPGAGGRINRSGNLRTAELDAWLWQVKRSTTEIVGSEDWEDAVRTLQIDRRSRSSLIAWLAKDEIPEDLRERVSASLREAG